MKNFFKFIFYSIIIFNIGVRIAIFGYYHSWDLLGVHVKEIYSNHENDVLAVSENGKYGYMSHGELFNFQERTISQYDVRFVGFISNRYIKTIQEEMSHFPIFDIETKESFLGKIYSEGEIDLVEINNLYESGHEFTISGGFIYIISPLDAKNENSIIRVNPVKKPDESFMTYSKYELKQMFPEAIYIKSGECAICISPDRKFIMSRNGVENLNGELIFSKDDIFSINPFFNLKYLSLLGWTADGKGIVASYGKTHLYKGFGYPYVQYKHRLPRRVIIIPFP